MNEKDNKKEKQRTRKIQLNFRVDEDEYKFIQAKMKKTGTRNRTAYLRKMAIDGKLIRYSFTGFELEIRKANYLISNISNSTNQIAKRVNSTSNLYDEDIADLKKQLEEIRKIQRKIMLLFMREIDED